MALTCFGDCRAEGLCYPTFSNPLATRGGIMEQGEIVVERLTGKHVILLEKVNDKWICRFGEGRQENRRTFELAPSPLARVVELTAQVAGGLSNLFGQLRARPAGL